MAEKPKMPEDFTVDELVSAWLEAQLMGRVVGIKQITNGPPSAKAIQKVTRLMSESKVISDLMKQVQDGVISRGARAVGLTESIPVSDKASTTEPTKITREQVEDAVNMMNSVMNDIGDEPMDLDDVLSSLEASESLKIVSEEELQESKQAKKEEKTKSEEPSAEKSDEKDTEEPKVQVPGFNWSF